jgi:hypothetical protein
VTPAGKALTDKYHELTAAQREELKRSIAAAYRQADPDDIVDSLGRIADKLMPTLKAHQLQAQQLAAGHLRALSIAETGSALEPLRMLEVAGTRLDGTSLRAGMEAFGPMVLDQIGRGQSPEAALESGQFYLERFADQEIRGAADRELANQQARPEIVGWEGIVSPDACDECQANAGPHTLDEELYRHGNCNCEKVPLFAGGAPGAEEPVARQELQMEIPAKAEVEPQLVAEAQAELNRLGELYPNVAVPGVEILPSQSYGGVTSSAGPIILRSSTLTTAGTVKSAAQNAKMIEVNGLPFAVSQGPRGVVAHEFGHKVQAHLERSPQLRARFKAWMDGVAKAEKRDPISMYAESGLSREARKLSTYGWETFAEIFAAAERGVDKYNLLPLLRELGVRR